MSRIICVTGTDTGVGKTVLTTLLLAHLRSAGIHALAMKPFCTGSTEDLERIRAIQGDELPAKILNPFYFNEPLAPYVAAVRSRRKIDFSIAIGAVRKAARLCDCLIVEGAGGALTPITRTRTFADLAGLVKAEAIVVGPNRLGVLNHVLLTTEALRLRGVDRLKVALVEPSSKNLASVTNYSVLRETQRFINVFRVPRLKWRLADSIEKSAGSKNFKKTLAQICDPDNVCLVVRTAETKQRNERLKKRK